MGNYKEKQQRILRLIEILKRNSALNRSLTPKELYDCIKEEHPITKRTLFKDLVNIDIYEDIEIEKVSRGRYLIKLDTKSLEYAHNIEPSEENLSYLYNIRDLLTNFKGLPQEFAIKALIEKMEQQLGKSASLKNIIHFNQPKQTGLHEYFDKIYSSIKKQKKVLIEYKPYIKPYLNTTNASCYYESVNNTYKWLVDPWILKEYNGRWQLIGKSTQLLNLQRDSGIKKPEGIINIALDRIIGFTESDFDAQECPQEILSRFDHIIGFTVGPVKTIKLKFYKESLPYVLSKPLHWTQKVVEKDVNGDWAILSYKVAINRELKQQVVQYLPYVEPVNPKKLLDDFLKVKKKR